MKNGRTKKIKRIMRNNGKDFYKKRSEDILMKGKSKEDKKRIENNRKSMVKTTHKVMNDLKEQEKRIQKRKSDRLKK